MSRWSSLSLLLACLVCLFTSLAPSAFARGRLDPSFGDMGVVDVSEDLGSGSLGALAVAPDRSIYFIESSPVCYRGGCPNMVRLRRYRADGSLDRRINGVAAARAIEGEFLLVDPAGRPVLAWERHSGGGVIAIRRFRPGGAVDRSFGDNGTVTLDCGCFFESLALAPGGKLIASGYWETKRRGKGVRVKSKWFFARLKPDGGLDRSFGRGGVVWLPQPAYFSPDQIVPARVGNFLAGTRPLSHEASVPFVTRLSDRGHLARRYAARTRRSLVGLPQTSREAIGWEGISLIPRGRGEVDVYGFFYNGKGVAVRLRPDGSRDRSFGHRGVASFPFDLNDVVSDGAGGALAVGYKRGRYGVSRVDPGGRIDRRFGRVALPGAYNEYGLEIYAAGRGAAVVLARGESVCRFGCPSEPKLFRVLR
ncbi:MAG TPA: hypothetical protein VJQ84_04315 [Solirubrobacterales bacterium]|nr:hypothetical protein [Solirubrobacterales bacterium]